MTLSMYQASVPVMTHTLKALLNILGKAEAHCEMRKIDPSILVQGRLFPDMFPLARQIQIASDQAKGGTARLAGMEVPSYEDKETTFAELKARVQKTLDFIGSVPAAKIDGSESRDISLKVGPNEMKFKGQEYLLNFVMPNIYFHITVAYSILRHNGVEVGKKDFLGV